MSVRVGVCVVVLLLAAFWADAPVEASVQFNINVDHFEAKSLSGRDLDVMPLLQLALSFRLLWRAKRAGGLP